MTARINRRKQADMSPTQFESFRTEMKKLRKANGLTLAGLADLLDSTQSHLSNIENGKRCPSEELARDIADVFDVSLEDMFVSAKERYIEQCKEAGRDLIRNRVSRGFTINQVAGFLGIPREAYLNYEHGEGMLTNGLKEAADLLFAETTKVETVEVIKEVEVEKEVPAPSPIGLDTISKVLDHVADMDIDVDEKRALFRELSEIKTAMLEAKLFG